MSITDFMPVTGMKDRLRLALAAANMAIWELTVHGKSLDSGELAWTGEGLNLLGLAAADFRQPFPAFLQIVHPDDREPLRQAMQRAIAQQSPYEQEYRVVWPDFSTHRLVTKGCIVSDPEGGAVRAIGVTWDITRRSKTEERLRLVLDAASMAIWDSEIPNDKVHLSARDAAIIGLPPHPVHVSFDDYLEFVHPEDRARVRLTIQQAIKARAGYQLEYRIQQQNGSLRWISAKGHVYANAQGWPERTLGLLWDITDYKQASIALHRQKELAEATLRSIGDGIITINAAGQVQVLNRVAEQLTGWAIAAARDCPITTVYKVADENSRETMPNLAMKCMEECRSMGNSSGILIARDGREIPIQDSASPILSPEGRVIGAVVIVHDLSHERQLKQQLSWQAAHDALTGLINRREFETRLADALASAKNDSSAHALLYMDLDQFKIVNDTCGHVAGDELLRQLTVLLHSKMRDSDVLARLGGDELGVLLRDCPLTQAHYLADELRRAVKDFRFIWHKHGFEISVSIGLVPITAESLSLSELMSAADRACYAAKEQGGNRVHLFRESDEVLAARHGEMLWISRLNQAFEQDRFVLYAQPIVNINGNGASHAEVLLRMRDEHGELVAPGLFIPAAERYHMMPVIDRWVIANCLKRLSPKSASAADRHESYSINLSGISLSDEQLLPFISEQFRQNEVAPERICFEITETAAIANVLKARRFMDELRKMGSRFSLDDFGSGLSSFSYLQNFPVDYLKIDGIFVKDVATNEVNRAMVSAINQIGHVMGIKTIAEFVENDSILETVQEIGVDYAQGFAMGSVQPLM